jgi:beta-lactamase class A
MNPKTGVASRNQPTRLELPMRLLTPGLLLVLLAFLVGATLAEQAEQDRTPSGFDVAYVWSKDRVAVHRYRDRVARILGPGVARDLHVVEDNGLHGVVYLRRGDNEGAVRVARVHSRLLSKKGLDNAVPVASRDWETVPGELVQGAAVQQDLVQSDVAAIPDTVSASGPGDKARDLEAAVEAYIKELRRKGRISKDERTGWSVYDFTTGEKLVTINEEVQFQAASLIKPFVAAAFFHRVKNKELIYGPKSRRHMERMIHYSNNPSTNWVMRRVGGPDAVQRILKQNYPGIFRATSIVEYIPRGGKTYRNKASVRDYSRFLYALWKGNIVGAEEIKRLMSLPGADRLYTGAESVPIGTEVLNKTGSTARLCADMGILNVQGPDGKRYPYTLIGIIEKQEKARNYTSWIRSRSEVIRDVSNIVYEGIARHHDFGEVL